MADPRLTFNYPVEPPAPEPEITQDPGMLRKLGAIGVRIGGGTIGSLISSAGALTGIGTLPGAAIGGIIGGGSEALAEALEGSPISGKRILTEGVLTGIPMAKFLKPAKTAANIARGVGIAEIGNMARRSAAGGSILPETPLDAAFDVGTSALGGLGGYAVSKVPGAAEGHISINPRNIPEGAAEVSQAIEKEAAKPSLLSRIFAKKPEKVETLPGVPSANAENTLDQATGRDFSYKTSAPAKTFQTPRLEQGAPAPTTKAGQDAMLAKAGKGQPLTFEEHAAAQSIREKDPKGPFVRKMGIGQEGQDNSVTGVNAAEDEALKLDAQLRKEHGKALKEELDLLEKDRVAKAQAAEAAKAKEGLTPLPPAVRESSSFKGPDGKRVNSSTRYVPGPQAVREAERAQDALWAPEIASENAALRQQQDVAEGLDRAKQNAMDRYLKQQQEVAEALDRSKNKAQDLATRQDQELREALDKSRTASFEKESAQEARNLNAREKYAEGEASMIEKALENQRKLDAISEAREGRVPTEPSISESVSAVDENGTRQSMRRSFVEPPSEEDVDLSGSGGGTPMGPRRPQFGDMFTDPDAARKAALAHGNAQIQTTGKGYKLVPKELKVRSTLAPEGYPQNPDQKTVPAADLGLNKPAAPAKGAAPIAQKPTTPPTEPPPAGPEPPPAPVPKGKKGPKGPKGGGGGAQGAVSKKTAQPETPINKTAFFTGNPVDDQLFRDVYEQAVKDGFVGDPYILRFEFNNKLASARDLQASMAEGIEKSSPKNLFRKIAAYGGIGPDKGYPGEMQHIWESSSGYIPGKGTTKSGRAAFGRRRATGGFLGIPNVLNQDGLTLDLMAEALRQEPEFSHIMGPNDLIRAIDEARRGGDSTNDILNALKGAGVRSGSKWWEAPIPDEVDELVPGLEGVRAVENPTPNVAEVPFSLSSEVAKPKPAESMELFGNEAPVAEAASHGTELPEPPKVVPEPEKVPPPPPPAADKPKDKGRVPTPKGAKKIPPSFQKATEQAQQAASAPPPAPQPEAKGAAPIRFFKTPVEAMETARDEAGAAYSKAKEAAAGAPRGTPANNLARQEGKAAQMLARQATQTSAEAEINRLTPEQVAAMSPEEKQSFLKRLLSEKGGSARIKGEKGEITPEVLSFLRHGIYGLVGAGAGAEMAPDDENKLPYILGGAAAGLAGPSAIKFAAEHSPNAGDVGRKIADYSSAIQRFNLLSGYPNIIYNSHLGPWSSALMGGIEEFLSGNTDEGIAAIKKGANPITFLRDMGSRWGEAADSVRYNEGRVGGVRTGESRFDGILSYPATAMLTGDLTGKDNLAAAGIPAHRAEEIMLTSEPWGKTAERVKSIAASPVGQLMLPFVRTALNIVQSGAERTPLLGIVTSAAKAAITHQPMEVQRMVAQQGLGALIGYGAYELGKVTPPDLVQEHKLDRAIANAGGQYSALAAAGFALGQATQAGRVENTGDAFVRWFSSYLSNTPLPTMQTPTDILKTVGGFINQEPPHPNATTPWERWLPRAAYPAFLRGEELEDDSEFLRRLLGTSVDDNEPNF